jgi:hypothetical protein
MILAGMISSKRIVAPHTTFEFIAKFFENSLDELSRRNPGIEATFRRIDANRFSALVYKGGRAVSRCTVFIGSRLVGNGIAYSSSETEETNAYNEMLSVAADDQTLYLKALGMAHFHVDQNAKLSPEGAAEYYWSLLIERLQAR